MDKKKFTFIGCSLTAGQGLALQKLDANNFANIVATAFDAEIKNLSDGGLSNQDIFMSSINEILFEKPNVLVVQWTVLNKLWLYPEPDSKIFVALEPTHSFSNRGITFTANEIEKVARLNGDYHNLFALTNYCNILAEIAKDTTTVIFINGSLPWSKDLADTDSMTDYGAKLSQYSKELLGFDNRDDDEITKIFLELNQQINTLDQSKWISVFEPITNLCMDRGLDGTSPGPKSHKRFADTIINYLNSNND